MDASGGVEAGLETAVKAGRATGTAACFVLNKCDRENANPSAALDALRADVRQQDRPAPPRDRRRGHVLGLRRPRPSQGVPVRGRQAEVEIRDPGRARRRGRAASGPAARGGGRGRRRRVREVPRARRRSSDAELDACLHKGVRESVLAPVLVASATKGIGLNALLDAIVRYLPSPEEEGPYAATDKAGKDVEVAADRQPAPRPRVQDRGRPVRRAADLPARPVGHAQEPGRRSSTRPRARTSGSASCSISTARSRSRPRSCGRARSARSPSSA